MVSRIKLGDIELDVAFKGIKNVHLSVYPPAGRVRVSAPSRMRLETIRFFVISKLDWIKRQQRKLREQERETPRGYLNRESHYLWGKRYLLKIVEEDAPAVLILKHSNIELRIRPGTNDAKKHALFEEWYRVQIKDAAIPLIAKWQFAMDVRVNRLFVQHMKTKWGSCNHSRGSIRLNTDLAKKPRECVEYLIVHELIHLREPTHNDRFIALMDNFMPNWRLRRAQLNQLPVRHEEWTY